MSIHSPSHPDTRATLGTSLPSRADQFTTIIPPSTTTNIAPPRLSPAIPRLQHLIRQIATPASTNTTLTTTTTATIRKMSNATDRLITPPAPWSHQFQEHLSKMSSPEFVFGTIHPTPPAISSRTPTPFVPRLRYCIYRGMWSTLPENKHNSAPRNPTVYASDMPTFTTDVRMEKVGDLFATSVGGEKAGGREELMKGSGGGGAVEAVWWIKEVGMQWRVRGRGYIVGPDIDWEDRQSGKASSGVRTVKNALGERMRIVDDGGDEDGDKEDPDKKKKKEKKQREEWSWERELTGHFGNCSPGMRGTWKNPPPGKPTEGKEPEAGHELGQKVEDLDDSVARANFRVVIIKPDEVESVDLSDPANARRMKYTFVVEAGKEGQEEEGEWKVEELWP